MPQPAARPAPSERPRQARRTPDGRWAKGHSGRPPGILDKRTRFTKAALEVAARHVPKVLEAALTAKSVRLRFDAAAWLCEMLLGKPRQALEVEGVADVAKELGLALARAREAHALRAVGGGEIAADCTPVVPLLPAGVEGSALTAEGARLGEPLPGSAGAVSEGEGASQRPQGAANGSDVVEARPQSDPATAPDVGEGAGLLAPAEGAK